jgi:hypothetical protein
MLHGSSGIDNMVCDTKKMSSRCIAGSSFKKKRRRNVASVDALYGEVAHRKHLKAASGVSHPA